MSNLSKLSELIFGHYCRSILQLNTLPSASICHRAPPAILMRTVPRGAWKQSRGYLTNFGLLCTVAIMALLFWGNSAQAISLAGSKTARIIPQEDVRRFIGIGPTTGQYVDAGRNVDLEGEAIELTFWHRRGSWNFTQSLGISYYQMDGSRAAAGETTTVDYSRLTLNGSLGYAFDLGFVDIHPQYMVGLGEGNFGYKNENGATQEIDISNAIMVTGPQLLLHFDFSKSYFFGIKIADYGNVGSVKFEDGDGEVQQNRVFMLTFGYRVQRSYSVFSKNRSHHSGIIDWFGY